MPPGGFVLAQAARTARARTGLAAVYAVRTGGASGEARLRVDAHGGASLEATLPPPAAAVVARLLAGDADGAARLLGVDPGATSLVRFDGHAAVAVGAARPGAAVPQLWVDHERFVPLRALAGDLDVRLLGTAGLLSIAGLPARIEVRQRGRLTWEAWLSSRPRRP